MKQSEKLNQVFSKLSAFSFPLNGDENIKKFLKLKEKMISVLNEVYSSDDIHILLQVLGLSIEHEILFFNDQAKAINLSKSLDEALKLVFDTNFYLKIANTFASIDKDNEHLPYDKIRDYIARCKRKVLFNLTYSNAYFIQIDEILMNIVIKAEEIYKDLQRKAVVGESNILRSETNTFPERIALEVGYYRITPLQVKRTVNNFLPNYSYDEKMEFYNFLYSNKELSYLEIEALGSKFFSNQPNFANLIPKLPLIQLNCLLNSITDTIDDTYYFVNDPEFLDKLNDEDEKEQACHTHLIQQDLLNNIRDLQNINKVIQQEIARLGN